MAQTLMDLLKALLNATLLLLALCLYLGWQLFSSAEAVVDRLGEISNNIRPLHTQAQLITQEFTELSEALSNAEIPDSTEMRLRLSRLEEELAALRLEIQSLKQLPAEVVSTAVETAVQELSDNITNWLPLLEKTRTRAGQIPAAQNPVGD